MANKNKIGQTVGKIIIGGVSVISGIAPVQPEQLPIQKPTTQLNSVVNRENKQRRDRNQPGRHTQDKAQKK
jgi:hypothetical protein